MKTQARDGMHARREAIELRANASSAFAASGVQHAPTASLRALGEMANGSARVAQLRALAQRINSSARMVAQRETVVQLGKVHDKALRKLGKSKGKLSHRRSTTAYGYFNKFGKRRQQGPHSTAHITTAVAVEVAKKTGRDFGSIVGSKLVPRPRVARYILRDIFNPSGISKSAKIKRRLEARDSMTAYLKRYNALYKKAKNGDKKAIEQLMELHPLQTYNLFKGKTTSGEIAGKGERRRRAIKDLKALGKIKKGGVIPKGLKTIDPSSLKGGSYALHVDRARNLARLATTDDDLSDGSDIGSDSDSEVELED